MKSISAELKAHYALPETTLAILVKITRVDGEVLAVTFGYDQNITYPVIGGTTYVSGYDLVPASMVTSSAMNVDSMDVRGALLTLGVTEADINAGLWDNAEFAVIRVNWSDLSMGHEEMKYGWFGEISIGRSEFTTELRGLTQKLQATIGDLVSPSCKNDLFDSMCGIPMTEGTWKFSSTAVTGVTSNRRFAMSSLVQADGFFNRGKVTWTTGANTGLSMDIKSSTTGGNIELQEPMPYDIAVTDQATLFAGCQLRYTEDCGTKFNNKVNFGGFPHLPGEDQVFKGV